MLGMRPVRADRDSSGDSGQPVSVKARVWTTHDGTDDPALPARLERLAKRMRSEPDDRDLGQPIDLAKLDRLMFNRYRPVMRNYARAWRQHGAFHSGRRSGSVPYYGRAIGAVDP